MDRLLRMDREAYLQQMRAEVERILGQVADAVNDAPDGKVINGSEMQVRDLMNELRKTAYTKAVQMRINATEARFFPSPGRARPAQDRRWHSGHTVLQRPAGHVVPRAVSVLCRLARQPGPTDSCASV